MSKVSNLRINFMKRNARKGGPALSNMINDSFHEISIDLVSIQDQWNNRLKPLLDALPTGEGGDGTDLLDAYDVGLDGAVIYADSNTETTDNYFYNALKSRPNTIKEQFDSVYTYTNTLSNELREEFNNLTGILTDIQKAKIGMNIFESSQSSSSDSLDGLTQSNQLNMIQIANDIYDADSGWSMTGDGDPLLTYSLKDMVHELLQLHNGSWNSDIVISHANQVSFDDVTGSLAQTRILTGSIDQDYVGVPGNLEDQLNSIRVAIRNLSSGKDDNWETIPTHPWKVGEFADVKEIASWAGTGTRDNVNPLGMHLQDLDGDYTDIVDLSSVLSNTRSFTGQDDVSDSTPDYSSVVYVTPSASLETAIGELDLALETHELLTNNPHTVTLTQASSAGGEAPADQITISDAGGLIIATDVEDSLQEIVTNLNLEISNRGTFDLLVSGELQSGINSLTTYVDSGINRVDYEHNLHLADLTNPHSVTAAQLGSSAIITELQGASGAELLPVAIMPSETIFETDLNAHRKGVEATLPSGEHWSSNIDVTDNPYAAAQSLTDLDSALTFVLSSEDFRRQNYSFSSWTNGSTIHINHNKSMIPIVQILDYQTNTIIIPNIEILHSGIDDIFVTNQTGSELLSGLILVQW